MTREVNDSCKVYQKRLASEKNGTNQFVNEVYARLPQKEVDWNQLIEHASGWSILPSEPLSFQRPREDEEVQV